MLGGRGHWTESHANPDVFAERINVHTRKRERQQRIRLCNRVLSHYGLSLSDWSGPSYLLKSRTGRTALVADLAALWPAAQTIGKCECDPLDSHLLERLERAAQDV